MPACQVIRQERKGRVELHLSGSFDGAAAWELGSRLSAERQPVVVDFSQVANFNDYGLAVLAHAVTERENRSLMLVGLRQHQLRMLHYLGCDVDDLGLALQQPVRLAEELPARALSA